MKWRLGNGAARRFCMLLILGTVWLWGTATAQTTTGTLRGTVKDETGGALPGTTIEAVNDETGVKLTAVAQASGFYNLSLQPAPYTVTATLPSFAPAVRKVVVVLGQTQGLDFELKLAAKAAESVTVSAEAPRIEAKSSEIATNVSEQQLQQLPQDNRNFLNFANLAPGVRTATDENNKEIQAGAVPGFNTNVFIDGTSYKNDVLNGGVVGQDSSRGNPFPQNAVQEFRVITQNYKAEYEKASSAIISAVTKSGENDFHGDGFAQYQDKSLVATNICDELSNRCAGAPKPGFEKPDYTRWQAGVSHRRPDRPGQGAFLRFLGVPRPEPQQQRVGRVADQSSPRAHANPAAGPTGQLSEPVQVEPGVRQDLLAGAPERSRGLYRLLPA